MGPLNRGRHVGDEPVYAEGLEAQRIVDHYRVASLAALEALFDHKDARDHDETLPNGAGHTWRCIPIAEAVQTVATASDAGHRRFRLVRDVDTTGISGTGVVAEGVQFSHGTCVLAWVVGDHRSIGVYPNLVAVGAIHGHGGSTKVEWVDV